MTSRFRLLTTLQTRALRWLLMGTALLLANSAYLWVATHIGQEGQEPGVRNGCCACGAHSNLVGTACAGSRCPNPRSAKIQRARLLRPATPRQPSGGAGGK